MLFINSTIFIKVQENIKKISYLYLYYTPRPTKNQICYYLFIVNNNKKLIPKWRTQCITSSWRVSIPYVSSFALSASLRLHISWLRQTKCSSNTTHIQSNMTPQAHTTKQKYMTKWRSLRIVCTAWTIAYSASNNNRQYQS